MLTTRELNRATLDRQLWTRIEGFDPRAFSRQLENRETVRISLHRSTIHTVTAHDCLWRLETHRGRTRATLVITPFVRLPRAARTALEDEGAELLALYAPEGDLDIRWNAG